MNSQLNEFDPNTPDTPLTPLRWPERRYLGDSVYARHDGYHLILELDNGYGAHTMIALDAETLMGFDRYRKYANEFWMEQRDGRSG